MPFSIHPATIADADAMASCEMEAFSTDRLNRSISGKATTADRHPLSVKYYEKEFKNAHLNGGRFYKAIDDENGEVAAFAKWNFPHTLTEEEKKQKEALDAEDSHKPAEGTNIGAFEDFFQQLNAGRKKNIKPESMYFCHILMVYPAYQRRGIGSRLIRIVLDQADRDGKQTYIEASPVGLPLYLKHGWEPIGDIVVDMNKYGEDWVAVQKQLIREPNRGITATVEARDLAS